MQEVTNENAPVNAEDTAGRDDGDPFAIFGEWSSAEDEAAYGSL